MPKKLVIAIGFPHSSLSVPPSLAWHRLRDGLCSRLTARMERNYPVAKIAPYPSIARDPEVQKLLGETNDAWFGQMSDFRKLVPH